MLAPQRPARIGIVHIIPTTLLTVAKNGLIMKVDKPYQDQSREGIGEMPNPAVLVKQRQIVEKWKKRKKKNG